MLIVDLAACREAWPNDGLESASRAAAYRTGNFSPCIAREKRLSERVVVATFNTLAPMHMRTCLIVLTACIQTFVTGFLEASEPILRAASVAVTNAEKTVKWTPYPAVQQYNVFSADSVAGPYSNDTRGLFLGNMWTTTNSQSAQFFQVSAMPISSNALLSAHVLNRLAYGPTPDELERLAAIGPQAFIDEQLNMASIVENGDAYTVAFATNGVNPPTPQWVFVQITGRATTGSSRSNLYVYLTTPGEAYIDDLQLTAPTNNVNTGNLVYNGGFESPLAGTWTLGAIVSGSSVSAAYAHSGSSSLHLVSTGSGSNETTSVSQRVQPVLRDRETVVLSFWYLQSSNSSRINIRLSGTDATASGQDPLPAPQWVYATATGTATTTPSLYLYLSGLGEAYIDDIKLVPGTVPEQGVNLVQNGDFETGLMAPWQPLATHTNSVIASDVSHSGLFSLKIVATNAGAGAGNSIVQTVPVTNAQTYTVSFWYLPATSNRTLTVRLSGSQLSATPDSDWAGLRRRLDTMGEARLNTLEGHTVDTFGGVTLAELQSWFALNAAYSKRQLLEVLSQFIENHFVTYHAKTMDYLDRFYDGGILDRLAASWEYNEMRKWRQALMNTNCTFYDLLKISAESPAMIVYLDTVDSRGNGNNIANENYARELFELFCNGVDNGYDQIDIVQSSRAWAGWSVELVDPDQVNNPFAAPSTVYGFYPGIGSSSKSNVVGVWSFNYKQGNHNNNSKYIFFNWDATGTNRLGPKMVPARFGVPWAGQPYGLTLTNGSGNNGIQDGYQLIQHLANLPFTMEYLSVKLCRLLVHDDFPNPTSRAGLPEYDFYDYTNPNASDEAKLVHACVVAWDTPAADGRKGNLRAVLNTIFNSALFRTHPAAQQKVKTPFEFTISAVRALRANLNGTYTATLDGAAIPTALGRIGPMSLFNRAEPDGYPEVAPAWVSAGTLAERIRFVQSMLTALGSANRPTDAGNSSANPVALLKAKLPAASWNDAAAVADYFVGVLFPGEGAANLQFYRSLAINFLNTGDDVDQVTGAGTSSPFLNLNNTTTAYDTRVRGMAAMLMTLQRFQEQ
jgi:uncharacterized protein (DUF1800 family)